MSAAQETMRASSNLITSAPGKAVIAGEYAVLEGYPALVAAVGARVRCRATQSAKGSGLVDLVVDEARRRGVHVGDWQFAIDSSELFRNGKKIGLGSSAAVAVAVAGQLEENPFELAFAAHRRFSKGLGSGIDVAASCFGGLIEFTAGTNGCAPTVLSLPCPAADSLLLISTGQSQRTGDFLAKIVLAKEREATVYKELISQLAQVVPTVKQALLEVETNWDLLSKAVFLHNQTLAKLGSWAQIDIFSPSHQRIAMLASRCGGTAKPSGAGGGDMAICFIPNTERSRFIGLIQGNGFQFIDIKFFVPGVTRSNV